MLSRTLALMLMVVATATAQKDSRMKSRDGYVKYADLGYYKLETKEPLSWGEARKACQDDNTHLAIVNSRKEQDVLQNLTKEQDIEVAYLGFHDLFTVDEWVTIFGEPLNDTGYEQCSRYYETYDGRCGTIDPGGVSNFECSVARPYICEKELWTDYVFFPEIGYYKLHLHEKTWSEAYDYCEMETAHLAIIKSEAEQTALFTLIQNSTSVTNAHIGYHSLFLVGEYMTVKGEPLETTGYVHWAPNEPANPDTDRCGSLSKEGLTNVECSLKRPFICEHHL